MAPSTAAFFLPLLLAAGGQRSVLFTWAKVNGAIGYQLQVGRDPAFTQVVLDETVRTTRYNWRTPDGADYVWRVRALEVDGRAGAWSRAEVNRAETPDEPPPVASSTPPALLSPADSARLVYESDEQRLELSFSAGTPAAPMQVEVARDPAFTDRVWETSTTATRVRLGLPGVGTFYWRVTRAAITEAPAAISPTHSLRISLGAPAVVEPADGALVDAGAALRWRAVAPAARWRVELRGAEVVNHETASASLPLTAVASGAYTWRVRALDSRGKAGGWSETRAVRLMPASFRTLAPADGAAVSSGDGASVTFAWEPVAFAARYELELANDAEFTAGLARHPTETTTLALPLAAGTYHWRVIASPAETDLRVVSAPARFDLIRARGEERPVPHPPLPVDGERIAWLGAAVGLHGNLGTVWAALFRLEGAWVLGAIDRHLLLVARFGIYQNQSVYHVPDTSIRLQQRAWVLPCSVAGAWRAELDPVEVIAGLGPAVQLAYLEVGQEASWSVRPGGEAFASVGYPLGPGVVAVELGLFVNANLDELLALPIGSAMLTAGYRMGW